MGHAWLGVREGSGRVRARVRVRIMARIVGWTPHRQPNTRTFAARGHISLIVLHQCLIPLSDGVARCN